MRVPQPASQRMATAAVVLAAVALAFVGVPAEALSRAQFPAQSIGNRGLEVSALQHLLRQRGWSLEASGFFGDETRSALIAFQQAHGLKADGIAGTATWRALVPRLVIGASGEGVIALQKQLNGKRDAGQALNGSFDLATEAALKAFQKRVGLVQSGIADEATWRNLLGHFQRPALDGPLCGYELVSGRSAKWGTAAAVAQLSAAAQLYHQRTGRQLAIGDMAAQRGGPLAGHHTHRVGLDVDIRTARKDGLSICRAGISHAMRSYDRAATRQLIESIYETAPGHVKLIYFNDPVLINEGLVERHPNHDAHMHVRYCEADHPLPGYRCPTGDEALLAVDVLLLAPEPGRSSGRPIVSMLRCGPAEWAI